jgi:hypothetical protein
VAGPPPVLAVPLLVVARLGNRLVTIEHPVGSFSPEKATGKRKIKLKR